MEINFNEITQKWDEFVSRSPHRSIFSYSKFLDSLKISYNLVTCYDKNEIVAGMVVLLTDQGVAMDSLFPFTMYQGILLSTKTNLNYHSRISYEIKLLSYFIPKVIERYKKFISCQSWRFEDLRSFQWHNYHHPEKGTFKFNLRYTAILNLKDYKNFNEYWTCVRTVRRQELKKSETLLTLGPLDDEHIIDTLLNKTFERQGIKRDLGESFLVQSITKNAVANQYGCLKCASLEDKIVSAILFLYDERSAYYLFGANDPEYRNTFAGTFLLSHMIEDVFFRGLQEVDFVGVNSPNRGDYKISFNAELKPYFIIVF